MSDRLDRIIPDYGDYSLDSLLTELSPAAMPDEGSLSLSAGPAAEDAPAEQVFEGTCASSVVTDEAALDLFKRMKGGMPERINETKGCFAYLEQFDPDYGCDKRIYED